MTFFFLFWNSPWTNYIPVFVPIEGVRILPPPPVDLRDTQVRDTVWDYAIRGTQSCAIYEVPTVIELYRWPFVLLFKNMADEGERYQCSSQKQCQLKCGKAKNGKVDFVRQEYKRYKQKRPPPDFSEVIDFEKSETFRERVNEFPLRDFPHSKFGLRCAREWRAYELRSCPGFIFIVNPFFRGAQRYWTRRCIRDFPRKPNVCNLDAHMKLDAGESVWEMSENQR